MGAGAGAGAGTGEEGQDAGDGDGGADDPSAANGTAVEMYTGGWDNGHRHGVGTQTYADGRRYEGGWKQDKLVRALRVLPPCKGESLLWRWQSYVSFEAWRGRVIAPMRFPSAAKRAPGIAATKAE